MCGHMCVTGCCGKCAIVNQLKDSGRSRSALDPLPDLVFARMSCFRTVAAYYYLQSFNLSQFYHSITQTDYRRKGNREGEGRGD